MVMMRTGERIARTARLRLSCAAAVVRNGQILLTRRADNGRWCLPAGAVEPGESVSEACEREVFEETGLVVRTAKLIAVDSNPNRIFEYADGNRWHVIELLFLATPIGGAVRDTAESSEVRFFARKETAALDVMEHDRERIALAFSGDMAALIR